MAQAYEAVSREAERLGVAIENVEIVGLVPRDALDPSAPFFSEDKILERQIEKCRPFDPRLRSEPDDHAP
jgi:glutamate formiminotransferase